LQAAGKAQEDDRSDAHRGQQEFEFPGLGMERTTNREAERNCAPAKRIEVDAVRCSAHKDAS
jgi:hypothetical protein